MTIKLNDKTMKNPRTLLEIYDDPRIDEVYIDGDGYWIYLKKGYDSNQDSFEVRRTIHEQTVQEICNKMRNVTTEKPE